MSEVRAGDAIAVYGLLRSGESGFERFGLAGAFEPLGPCVIPGQLYDLGAYPGLVIGEGEVIGEVFEVRDPGVMSALDAFEDFWPGEPERSRYERVEVALIKPDLRAWVYAWRLSLDRARRIESGDWFKR